MRIAYVYDAIYPYISGGVERRVWEVSRRLAERGHDVHIYGMHLWGGEKIIQKDGVTLHGICSPHTLYRKGKRTFSQAIIFGVSVFWPLTKEHFDIVDCQQFPYFSALSAILSSRITRSPLVITWHEVWEDYWYDYIGPLGFIGKTLERLVARSHTPAIAVSELTKDGLSRLAGGKDIGIIPNGIDLRAIEGIRPAHRSSDIIFVGRLIKEKHVDVLLEALFILKETIPDIRCLIIGDGPERRDLELKVMKTGLMSNALFTGFLQTPEDIIAHMKSSKVFVLPSIREGFGIAALEALACGLPVVTVDHPKNASKIFAEGGCGLLSSLDPADMATKLHDILTETRKDPDGCRFAARDYDWEVVTERLETYYRKMRNLKG